MKKPLFNIGERVRFKKDHKVSELIKSARKNDFIIEEIETDSTDSFNVYRYKLSKNGNSDSESSFWNCHWYEIRLESIEKFEVIDYVLQGEEK